MRHTHLSTPTCTLYDRQGRLRRCYGVDAVLDLSFSEEKFFKRKGIQSKIPGLSIGDVRQSFQQLRVLGASLGCDSVLWNGQTAGAFALEYLIRTYEQKKRKGHACRNASPA
tara:strand:+ start:1186 stop:1521 length:336 start_codon:yes stop_codon:yes gene_type:complete